MSISQKGRKHSKETLIKLSEVKRKENLSSETLKKYSERQLGSKNAMAKLNEDDVCEIKLLLMNGVSQSKIAKKFNVNRSNIGQIANGNTWTDVYVEGWVNIINPRYKLNEDKVIEIKQMLKEGFSLNKIAEKYNVSDTIIWEIKVGRKWKIDI